MTTQYVRQRCTSPHTQAKGKPAQDEHTPGARPGHCKQTKRHRSTVLLYYCKATHHRMPSNPRMRAKRATDRKNRRRRRRRERAKKTRPEKEPWARAPPRREADPTTAGPRENRSRGEAKPTENENEATESEPESEAAEAESEKRKHGPKAAPQKATRPPAATGSAREGTTPTARTRQPTRASRPADAG